MGLLQHYFRVVCAFFLFALMLPAHAQVKWDMYAFSGATHPITLRLKDFAETVKKETNGQLVITVRPAGEFPFKAPEVVRAVSTGQVQIGEGYAGFISGVIPLASVANLPLLIRNNEDLEKIWPIVQKYAYPEFEKQGVKVLFHFEWPPQNIFGRGTPIKKPEDFAGKKLRTTDAKQSEMLKRLGATSVSIAPAEVPLAIERGVVDGFTTAAFNVIGAKWYEFVKWAYLPDLNAGGPDFVMVNIAAYNKLDPKLRQVLDSVAAKWGPMMTKENIGYENRDLDILKNKYGVELYRPSPKEVAELTDMMKPLWDAWAKQQGPTAVTMLKEIREVLKK